MKNVRVEVVRNTRNVVLMIRKKIAEIIRATYSAQTFEEVKHILNKPMNIYQIKVELVRMGPWKIESEVYRTFKLKGNQTLYDLHMNIQYAFDWDNDHMFSFYLGDELFDRDNEYSANPLGEHIISSFGKPTKSASKAQLRDLSITASSSFWYLFDYGDELVHKVTVEEIYEMMSEDKDLPTVINKIGDAPPQYPMQEE